LLKLMGIEAWYWGINSKSLGLSRQIPTAFKALPTPAFHQRIQKRKAISRLSYPIYPLHSTNQLEPIPIRLGIYKYIYIRVDLSCLP